MTFIGIGGGLENEPWAGPGGTYQALYDNWLATYRRAWAGSPERLTEVGLVAQSKW